MPTSDLITVLVIDDDPVDADMVRRLLSPDVTSRAVYRVHVAFSLTEARSFLDMGEHVDVMVVDHHMGETTGIDFVSERRAAGDVTPAVLVTGRGGENVRRQARLAGCYEYVEKDRLKDRAGSEVLDLILAASVEQAAQGARHPELVAAVRQQAAAVRAAAEAMVDLHGTVVAEHARSTAQILEAIAEGNRPWWSRALAAAQKHPIGALVALLVLTLLIITVVALVAPYVGPFFPAQ